MLVTPSGALLIGAIAGTLFTVGFNNLSPFLDRNLGLKDTCGVHNLHGIPGLLGGTISAIVTDSPYYQRRKSTLGIGYPTEDIWPQVAAETFPQLAGN